MFGDLDLSLLLYSYSSKLKIEDESESVLPTESTIKVDSIFIFSLGKLSSLF